MISGNEAWSLVSLAVAFLAMALGVYVVSVNPHARAARVFYLAMMVMFVAGCFDFLLMNAPDQAHAFGLALVLLFLMTLVSGLLFYLATFLPYERSSGWFRARWMAFFLAVAAVALVPAALLSPGDLLHTSYGWGVDDSWALGVWAAASVFLLLSADVMLAILSVGTEDSRVRAQIAIVAMAVSAPVVYGLLQSVLERSGVDMPPILSPGYLVAALLMAYAVLRYRLFAIQLAKPVRNGPPSLRRESEYGATLLFLEKKGARAFAHFQEEVGAGALGVIVSRTHPDLLRDRYQLESVPIIWLAQHPGEARIDPTNLGILQHSIAEFLRDHEGAAVLMEGVEYILANNPLESVLKMMYALDDEVVISKGLLMVTLDPESMSRQGLAMFVRDFQVVEDGRGRDRDLNSGLGIHSPTG